jgi:hypothetical protein
MFSYPCREGAKPEGEEGIEDDESYRRQAAAALESQASSSCVRKNTTTAPLILVKKVLPFPNEPAEREDSKKRGMFTRGFFAK